MMHHINTATVAISSFVSAVCGGKIGQLIADAIPEVSGSFWIKEILGPTGTLVAMGFALRWMTNRLDKQETKWDELEKKREEDRTKLIETITETNSVIKENSDLLKNTKRVTSECVHNFSSAKGELEK